MQIRPIQIAILDKQTIFRTALKTYLSCQSGINVAAQASTILELFQEIKNKRIDVLLVDMFEPGLGGFDAVATIRVKFRDMKILVLSMNMDMDLISDLLDSGIHGYISKEDQPEELLHAITEISNGNVYRNRFLTEAFYHNRQNLFRIASHDSFVTLDEREKRILRLIWEEKTNKEIAEELLLGIRSIEKLRQELKEKLRAKSTIGMLKYALRTRIVKGHFLQIQSE